MMGLGYCFCLVPFAKKKLADSEEISQFMRRNLGYFNTHPYMAGWIIGAAMHLEEQALSNEEVSVQQHDRFKARMSQFLGAVGDRIFWRLVKPLAALFGFAAALYSPLAGVVLFLLLYNLPHFYVRIKGVVSGYRGGMPVLRNLSFKYYNDLANRLLQIASFGVGFVLVITLNSRLVEDGLQSGLFLVSFVAVFLLFRKKVHVPATLLALIFVSVMIGFWLS